MKSEFTLIGDHSGHRCEIEMVRSRRTIEAIYVWFDGQRIAYRGDPEGPHQGTWVSMMPGFKCVDSEDLTTLSVYFNGSPLHFLH